MRVTACAIGASFFVFGCSDSAHEDIAQSPQSVASLSGETLETRAHSGSCMDVSGDSSTDGTQIDEWTCNGTAAQVFEVATTSAGVTSIVHVQSGKCIDVRGSGTADGTKVDLWDCNGTGAQAFQIRDAGGGVVTFVNTNSGKCLDVSGSNPADGTHVQLWDCNGTNAQAWAQTPLGGGDAGASDAGSVDAGANDTGASDTGTNDTGASDAGSVDAGASDAGASDAGASDASSSDTGSGGLPAGASDWLTPMNAARAAVGEAPFTWDPIATEVAQSWANQCSFGHNPSASSQYVALGGSGGLGEDVAAGAPSESVANAVASWVNEEQYYDHATNSCATGQVCGHYTQIVWKNSTAVGCAQTHCTTNSPFGASFPTWDMSVCDFNPPGNYVGESPY
jgi:pathogenesis-related protein 1